MIPMKKSSLVLLQKAIFERLSSGMSCSVHDEVQQGTSFPYLVIGDDTAVDDGEKNSNGEEITVTIHSWSQAKGWAEGKGLLDSALQLLTASPLIVAGFRVAFVRMDMLETFRDPDGITRHGVMRLRFKAFQEG